MSDKYYDDLMFIVKEIVEKDSRLQCKYMKRRRCYRVSFKPYQFQKMPDSKVSCCGWVIWNILKDKYIKANRETTWDHIHSYVLSEYLELIF